MAYLSEEQHKLVTGAVAQAELSTSGEIVTVLADRSDGYSDVIHVYCAAIAFTAMSIFAALPEPFLDFWDWLSGGWGQSWTTGELASMTIALGLISYVTGLLIFMWEPLKFAVLPAPIKSARVHAQAIKHFKVGAERRTTGHTGVLIYLSMREHRAEIVADETIASKVSADVWGVAMVDMLGEIRRGRVAEGMACGVRDVGIVLAEHFPRSDDDENELPDRLIEV
ncbi:MAG: hypothetical protein ABJP70_07765 [Erythrobacter sp.]